MQSNKIIIIIIIKYLFFIFPYNCNLHKCSFFITRVKNNYNLYNKINNNNNDDYYYSLFYYYYFGKCTPGQYIYEYITNEDSLVNSPNVMLKVFTASSSGFWVHAACCSWSDSIHINVSDYPDRHTFWYHYNH